MDRKGIFGLLVCGILFAAHLYYSGIERKEFIEEQAAKKELAEEKKREEAIARGEDPDAPEARPNGETAEKAACLLYTSPSPRDS